jgi:ribosomal protein S1
MTMKQGDTVRADVVEVEDDGIYLRHEDADGFVDVTKITWKQGPVRPQDHPQAGQRLDVLVYAVTPDRFYASLKDLHPEDNPWPDPGVYAIHRLHPGVVRKVTPFGAFIEIEHGPVGLLEGAPRDHRLQPGDRVEVRVVAVDPSAQTIALEKV